MLRGAVQEHGLKNAHRASPSQSFFTSSPPSPLKPASQRPPSRSTNPAHTRPLKPVAASALNGDRGSSQQQQQQQQHPSRTLSGVKRTANGLAKALDGSFDDGPGSQRQPIVLNDTMSYPVMFDENDFDSDIELDFEEPKSTASYPVSYPRLPPQPAAAAYPPLPMQQPAPAPSARNPSLPGAGYDPFDGVTTESAPPKSSALLPWSSSPDEHFRCAPGPPLKQLKHDPPPPLAGRRQGRTIPWLNEAPQKDSAPRQPTHSSATAKSSSRATGDSTPLRTDSKAPIHPWNTTASAIKEQQKKHREQNKKPTVKNNEGTEESERKAKSTRARPARVFLSEEQQQVLNLVTERKKSVFFTGSAGTGKSVLLREIIASLRKKYQREPDRIAVTASTGLAACNIGGVTLHSFAGIGLGKEDVPELVRKVRRNQKAKHRWMRTKVLVIDEVSMVDADLFDKLEATARQLRNNGRPFGGIQLVITGDFFQLPPVPDGKKGVAKFAFDAATWNTTVEHTIALHHVFRQKDPVFAGMLNEMREGRLSESSIQAFRNLSRDLTFQDTIEATELFPTRNEVERANTWRLGRLQGDAVVFEARDGGTITDKTNRDRLLANCMAPETIKLKKGAQVMLIKNIDETLVNGSLGRVIGFMSETKFDRYHEDEDAFLQNADGSNDDKPRASEKAFVHSLGGGGGGISTSTEYPVVRFMMADGTSRDLLCQPETWKVELPNGEVQASRSQLPLILAWALSIHKAQGQTLDRVKVDLGKVFEKGQAYVALSRATSMGGLQVLRFDPRKVMAHDRVKTFYSNLSRVETAAKGNERPEGGQKKMKPSAAEDYERLFVEDGWSD